MEFHNAELIESILRDRYYSNGEQSWEEVAHRVARYVASAGIAKGLSLSAIQARERAYEAIIQGRFFLPNSPTLFNAGVNTEKWLIKRLTESMSIENYSAIYDSRAKNACLSACFVVGIDDSMKDIYRALSDAALITKSGGGVGFSFSRLRPKGSNVRGTGGFSSGAVAFMEVFDRSAHVVRQGGRRRAAMMAVLRYDHPDILDFIHSKKNNDGTSVLSYFNISVDVDPDKFLELYKDDGDIILTHEYTGQVGTISARELMRTIAENAWKSGDPGMIFTSRHNESSSVGNTVKVESTNPCGEQYLFPGESCVLGSIDLTRAVDGKLDKIVEWAVDFLDDVVDINNFPIDKLGVVNSMNRNIGLGVMGVHDALIANGLPYDSQSGRMWVAEKMARIARVSYERSMNNGILFGSAPAFDGSRFEESGFVPFRMIDDESLEEENAKIRDVMERIRVNGIRNMSIGCIAPTGTISILSESSSAIEPSFAFSYGRTMISNSGERVQKHVESRSLENVKFSYDSDVLRETGSLLKAAIRNDEDGSNGYIPKTAQEIHPYDHILMQAVVQAYISNSVSKTINMPNSATVEDVESAFMIAMRSGCKGVTIYRDGSLSMQILETKKVPKREEELSGRTRVHNDDGKKTYVTVNFDDDGNPVEVFISGETRVSVLIGRFVSMALRAGIDWTEVVDQLHKTGGYSSEIGDVISDTIGEPRVDGDNNWQDTNKGFSVNEAGDTRCDSCGTVNSIIMHSGCVECSSCFWAACGA